LNFVRPANCVTSRSNLRTLAGGIDAIINQWATPIRGS
jgi:hypothetical protein